MTTEELLEALTDIDGKAIQNAQKAAPRKPQLKGRRFVVLIAAVIALMAVTMTAFAAENIVSWFQGFFAKNTQEELSQGQIQYIEENEQIIAESQTQSEWTVELRSVMSDGDTAYVIIGVTAPEGVSLAQNLDGDHYTDRFYLSNGEDGEVLSCSEKLFSAEGNYSVTGAVGWKEDGDGLENTKNVVWELSVNDLGLDTEMNIPELFGDNTEWYIHIDSIVHQYENEAYKQELLNGKYSGQTDIMFTSEEAELLDIEEVLAEGPWDFSFTFTGNEMGVELLSAPVVTEANVFIKTGPEITDYEHTIDDVTVTSVVLRPLSATISFEYDGGVNFTDFEERLVFAVMKDGSQIELEDYGGGGSSAVLKAKVPIVLEEVDYILLADGTKLPMPE